MSLTGDTFDFQQGNVVTSSAQMVDNAATVGNVLTVQADKSIAAAPGGGSQPHTQEQFFGPNTSVANNGQVALSFGASSGPDSLLDVTAPALPTVITTGTYAFTIDLIGVELTAGGYMLGTFEVDVAGNDVSAGMTSALANALDSTVNLTLTVVWYLTAGMQVKATVASRDGAANRNFSVAAFVQRIA